MDPFKDVGKFTEEIEVITSKHAPIVFVVSNPASEQLTLQSCSPIIWYSTFYDIYCQLFKQELAQAINFA